MIKIGGEGSVARYSLLQTLFVIIILKGLAFLHYILKEKEAL